MEDDQVVLTGNDERIGLYVRMGEAVGNAIANHEEHFHVPPRRRGPIQAVPFAHISLSDVQIVRARELLETGNTLHETADVLGVPASVVERELAAFEPHWQKYLRDLRTGI